MNVVESALAENSNDQDKKDENDMTSATEMNSEEDKLALAAEFWVNELKKDEPILENLNDQQHQNTFTAQKNVITLSEIKYDEVDLIFRARVNFSEESNGYQPLMEIPSGNHQGDNEDSSDEDEDENLILISERKKYVEKLKKLHAKVEQFYADKSMMGDYLNEDEDSDQEENTISDSRKKSSREDKLKKCYARAFYKAREDNLKKSFEELQARDEELKARESMLKNPHDFGQDALSEKEENTISEEEMKILAAQVWYNEPVSKKSNDQDTNSEDSEDEMTLDDAEHSKSKFPKKYIYMKKNRECTRH